MPGVLLIYPHSPSGDVHPRDHVYISVKPLAAMLQPINVQCMLYTYTYICTSVRICKYMLGMLR